MIYSCCTTLEHYGKVVNAGFDRIILSGVELSGMGKSTFQITREALDNANIKCHALNNFCGSDLKLCGPGFDNIAVREYSAALMERCGQIGVEYISLGAPKSRSIPDGYPKEKATDELKESLKAICAEAEKFGINILLEAVCTAECNFITYTSEAFAIVDSLKIKNLHLVFDTYHASKMGEDELPLQKVMNEIRLVHVAQDIDNRRGFPQEGFIEGHKVYFDKLLEFGFNGEVGVEASSTGVDGELINSLYILKKLCREKA